jgi:hypothetical protein
MTVTFQVHGDQAVVEYLASLPVELAAMILRKFQSRATEISQYIKNTLLNGVLLNRKTGRLANSIVGRVYSSKSKVTLSVASRGDVPYAGIYEHGGKIPPHIIRAKNASLLYFQGGRDGKMLALRQVDHPGTVVRARHYLEQGVQDKGQDFLSDIASAIYDASRSV